MQQAPLRRPRFARLPLTQQSFAWSFVTLLGLSIAAAAAEQLTMDAIFGEKANGKRAEQLQFKPDGKTLTYVWDDGSGRKLWTMDATTGKVAILVDYPSLPSVKEGDKGFAPSAYQWSPDGRQLLFTAAEDLFLLKPGGSTPPRRLTETTGEEESPTFSPDGRRLAYEREANLVLLDLASGKEESLTIDGKPGEILNGSTDWVYWEEIWNRNPEAFWWSPDGNALAYYRFDDRDVLTYPLVDYKPTYPKVEPQRYPKAGQTNPTVKIGVLDLGTRQTVWMKTGDDRSDYLVRLAWAPGSRRLGIEKLNRDQNRLELLSCDRATGDCAPTLVESLPTWVNLGEEMRYLADGSFLWASEREGWRHLYRGTAGGELKRLTPEGWAVSSLDGVLEPEGLAIVTAFRTEGLGAAERQVLAVRLDGSSSRPLTEGRGWHAAVVAAQGGAWVENGSDSDAPRPARLRDLAGRSVAELPFAPPSGYDLAALPKWKYLLIPGPGGSTLPARILEPVKLEEGRRYPALMVHYGGPGSQVVVDRWAGSRELWYHFMVERGFVVFSVDNQASTFFGKRGEDLLHRRFGEVELAGQLAGVAYLKSLPYVDGSRLGLFGWSGGGSNTLYSVLHRPGVWKAAVAGAPVTDWKLYDSVWTERYLDLPEENAEGYRLSSSITYADRLADALLVLHGTADDNVHPQNSIALFDALITKGRAFEQALYPGQKHGFRGASSRHSYERMTEFFERHLATP